MAATNKLPFPPMEDAANVWEEIRWKQKIYEEMLLGEAQADSTASDIAGIVADFNALLAKLRAARVIAE